MAREDVTEKLQNIALVAVRKKFSPEFVNRIDHVITYQPLNAESFAAITDHEIAESPEPREYPAGTDGASLSRCRSRRGNG